MPHDMAEGGGTESAPPVPAKRGMGWRLWAVIAVVVILVIAGAAYYLTRGGPSRDTKTLVYYMQSEPLTMDSSDAYDLWSFIAIQNTYDTLVGYKTDSLQLVGVLAQSWDILDAQHYVFHIRHGVKFWDGSNFTANDVYASFRKVLIENSPESGVAWILNQNLDASNIPGSLWVKDTFTIQMNLTVAYAGFLQTLATVEPSAIMSDAWITANGGVQPNTANDIIKHNTMGTAPYYMKASDWVAKDHMTLHKNPYFWRDRCNQVHKRRLFPGRGDPDRRGRPGGPAPFERESGVGLAWRRRKGERHGEERDRLHERDQRLHGGQRHWPARPPSVLLRIRL